MPLPYPTEPLLTAIERPRCEMPNPDVAGPHRTGLRGFRPADFRMLQVRTFTKAAGGRPT